MIWEGGGIEQNELMDTHNGGDFDGKGEGMSGGGRGYREDKL